MKMVKSLILGTAVAFAATAGAQAADLPVKAKPVSYVKICPQYGPGFYYIPGTDICLKVGGLLLAEVGYNSRSATPVLNAYEGTTIEPFRNDVNWRTRAYIALDSRQNTAYGVLRTYLYGGFEYVTGNHGYNGSVTNAVFASNGGSAGFMQFAFVQFAGFTAGIATSFFDFAPSYMTLGTAAVPWNWNNLIAYTARLGNGISATISIEDQTNYRVGVSGVTATPPAIAALGWTAANGYAGQDAPDVIANIRIDQAWGSAQVMGALHKIKTLLVGFEDWGYAIGAGLAINLPMLAAGDQIQFTVVYGEGTVEFTGGGGNPFTVAGRVGFAPGAAATPVDAHLGGGALTLTDNFSASAQFRHFWLPNLRSNFHVGYNEYVNRGAGAFGSIQLVQYGHSLVWSPVAGLNLALDVLYTQADANNVSSDIVTTWLRITRPF